MTTRTCPFCGAPDYGSPHCVSCQNPFPRLESDGASNGAGQGISIREARPAGFLRRFWALFVDLLVFSLISDAILFFYQLGLGKGQGVVNMDGVFGVMTVTALLYFTFLTGDSGQTLGKKLLGIRVICVDGTKVSYKRAFLRSLGYLLSVFFGTFLGFIWALWDRRKQAWHDKIAGTRVIRV